MQDELPLDPEIVTKESLKKPLIGWRRAHRRTSSTGRSVRVGMVVTNSDRGPHEEMLMRQLPERMKRPLPPSAIQIALNLDYDIDS